MAGITYTKANAAPAGGITIGDPVTGGNPDSVLYIDGSNNLNNSTDFRFDDVLHKFTTPDVNLVNNEINFTDGQLKSNGGSALTNNFFNNFFVTGPLGLGTLLQASVFTLEKTKVVEQSFWNFPAQTRMGSVGLSGGSVNKAAAWITANHFVFLSLVTPNAFYSPQITVVITPGVGFSITSANPGDGSTYNYIVFNSF